MFRISKKDNNIARTKLRGPLLFRELLPVGSREKGKKLFVLAK